MALETVVIKITGDSKDLNKTIDQLEKVGKVDKQNAASFKKTSKQMGSGFDSLKKKAMALGSTMLGAFAIQQVVSSAINTIKNFEKEMSTLQSITGSTVKEMEFFKQAAIDVGKATETSSTEVVKAFTMIGSAQPELLKNSKALAEVTKQALILSKAAGIDATSASTALTSAMNQFGVGAKDAAKFTDIFATSQQKGSSFIAATSEALKNTGAAANAAGLSFETTNAAIQALAKGSLVGSEAGTALRGVLIKLSSQSNDKINPSMVGLGNTIEELAKRNLTLKDATKLVGQEGATGLLTLIKQKDLFFELDGNLNSAGNAMSQMATNTDNLDGAMNRLTNALENAALEGSLIGGVLKVAVDDLALGIEKLGGETEETEGKFSLLGISFKVIRAHLMVVIVPVRELFKLFFHLGDTLQNKFRPQIESVGNFFKETIVPVFTTFKDVLTDTVRVLFSFGEKALKKIGIDIDLSAKALSLFNEIIGNTPVKTKEATKELEELDAVIKGTTESTKAQTEAEKKAAKKKADERIKQDKKLRQQIQQAQIKSIEDERLRAKRQAVFDSETKIKNAKGDAKLIAELEIAERERLRKQLADIDKKFADESLEFWNNEAKKKAEQDELGEENERNRKEKTIAAIINMQQQMFTIIAQINENRLIALDNEEKRALEALESQGLGEEELAEKKKAIQEKIAKQRAEILRKQFIADKAAALVQIAIDTALGIMKTIGQTGFLGTPLAVIIGTMGAAQAAIVAAQPVPEFHEGKKPELKDGEMFAKILKSESVIPPEQSRKYKGAIDSMIDKKFENYVFQEYMLPMMKSMSKKDVTPYNDVHLWNNQKKQIKLMQESNGLTKAMIKTLDNTNSRRSWK